ncbi:MAG: alpha/beta fold hydrolase [Rhodospirillales bacterium]|nr:alpha/beta fold hydrolase [Rhodospirillales bacterium]
MADGRSEKITFTGADDSSRLAARLDLPAGLPRAHALFAHCFTCASNVFAASRIAAGLVGHGFAVLRFDFTGLGASEGEFANTTFSSNVGDLVAAAAWLRREHEAPALLVGHSLGGAAVLAAAGQIPEARAVCTIAAPAEPAHITRLFAPAVPEIAARGEAEVVLAGRPFRIKKAFLDDVSGHRLAADIAALRRPLLIFHAPGDSTVGIDNASRIFAAAKHPKSFVSLDDADHLLTRREDAAYVADVLTAWAARYLASEAAAASQPVPDAPADAVVVAEAGTGRFAEVVNVGGRHILAADEPESVGGTDTGPGPYDYLLAALGACTAMTIRMYADRKGLPLDKVSVTLRHAKVHAEDCAECETRQGMLDRIEREITLDGALDDAARAKLLEIADKCPVHRTLHSEVWITTTLND